jgi:hypothetical protein
MARWRALAPEQRQAAGAAVGLLLAMFLPWYQSTAPAVVAGRPQEVKSALSAFEIFTWVEAAVLLVCAAVLWLLWARSERKAFHLPGGDGWAITAAGVWILALLIWRLFDKPGVEGAAVGIAWGIFVAVALAGAMIAAGQRLRAAGRPEPPNPMEDPLWESAPQRRRSDRRDPGDPTAVTEALRTRPPTWEGEPPEPPGRAPRPEISGPAQPSEEPTRPLGEPTRPLEEPPPDRLF